MQRQGHLGLVSFELLVIRHFFGHLQLIVEVTVPKETALMRDNAERARVRAITMKATNTADLADQWGNRATGELWSIELARENVVRRNTKGEAVGVLVEQIQFFIPFTRRRCSHALVTSITSQDSYSMINFVLQSKMTSPNYQNAPPTDGPAGQRTRWVRQ